MKDAKTLKTLLILLLASSVISCAKGFPEAPEITMVYEVDTDFKKCVRYQVVSQSPFKIKLLDYQPLEHCNFKIGLNIRDFQALIKYKTDSENWCKENKACKEALSL